MTLLADSNAYENPLRDLPQHQAALTLLQSSLENPNLAECHWLDLACGKGQIICHLEENIRDIQLRSKINYYAYDGNSEYIRDAERIARRLGLRATSTTAEIAHFPKIIDRDQKFNFISFTNTVHELRPHVISDVLFECVVRLAHDGEMYIYDMEELGSGAELGAIAWDAADMTEIIKAFLSGLDVVNYPLTCQRWHHKSCAGWSLFIQRKYLNISEQQMLVAKDQAVAQTATRMSEVLTRKLNLCRDALESLTICGATTEEEERNRVRLLYEYWALSRAQDTT